jgi:hypothetical protein
MTTERFKTKPKTKFWKVTADSDVVDVAPNSLRKVTDTYDFFSQTDFSVRREEPRRACSCR